jgi:hypothetical protein
MIESLQKRHLSHLRSCWRDSVKLAEESIGRPRTDDPLDVDARRLSVFELAQGFFGKCAVPLTDYIRLEEWEKFEGRKSKKVKK